MKRHLNKYHRPDQRQYNLVFILLVVASLLLAWMGLGQAVESAQAARELISPVAAEPKEVIEVPVIVTKNIDVLKIVDIVAVLESSNGQNKTPGALHLLCRAQGKENIWGYGGMALKKCFNTKEEGRAWIAYWWLRNLEKQNGNVSKVACIYNLGQAVETCPYAQKLISKLK